MLTDKYLINYLIENGYTREEIEAKDFNIASLRDDFSMPIDLSKVTNLDELKIFFAVSSSFLISKEDIDSGKAYKVSEMLINFKLIGNEPNLKLDKIFINRNNCFIEKDNERTGFYKSISFENIDFNDTEVIIGDSNAQREFEMKERDEFVSKAYIINLGDEFGGNIDYTLETVLGLAFPSLSFDKCTNIKLDKFKGFRCDISNSKNINCMEKCYLFNLIINNCENINLTNLDETDISVVELADIDELDLSKLSKSLSYDISNVKKCFSSRDMEFLKEIKFNNVDFSELNRSVSFEEVLLSQVIAPSSSLDLFAQKATIENSDFSIVKLMNIAKKLNMDNCFNVDDTIMKLIDRNYEDEEFSLETSNLSGYDIRKGLRILDLKKVENKDLLDNPYKLVEVLKDNKYLISILVPENLNDEQKKILGEFAPYVNYSYDFLGITEYENGGKRFIYNFYDFDKNEYEHVNFKEFLEAEKIFDEIVSEIKPGWSELEKFKYLYNELGKKVSYDINVLENKNDEKNSYNRANLVARNPFSSIISGNGVCAGYSEMYQYVCRKAGLTCDMEGSNNHRYNLIEYTNDNGEKVKSYCDLTWDARRIKYNSRCSYFGFSEEDEEHMELKCKEACKIPEDKVEELDKNVGYTYMVDKYMDLAKEAGPINETEGKVNFLLENMMKIQDISGMSNHEVVNLAWILLANSGVSINHTNVTSGFIRKNERQDKAVRDILWVKDETEKGEEDKYLYYTFNSDQQAFKPLDTETVYELLASGMLEFYADQKLPGFEDWMPEKQYKEMRNRGEDR